MKLSLVNIISIITTFQLFLLAVVMVNYKKRKRLSNLILSAFLFANGLFILNFIFFRSRVATPADFPLIYFCGNSLYFLLAPLLYLYTKSLCYKNFRFHKNYWLHFSPYVLAVGLYSISYWIRIAHLDPMINSSFVLISPIDYIIHYAGLHLQIILYAAAVIKAISVYRLKLKETFSSIENINLSWWLLIFMTFMLMWLMDLGSWLISLIHITAPMLTYLLTLLSLIINFIFATTVVYKGLKQPEIFSGIEEKPKYAQSKLTKEQGQKHIKRLIRYMKTQKPYLEPALTLPELAESLSIHPRYLSQAINDALQQNFYDFVNSYRIEEAKQKFANPAENDKTVLEILYEVGFNSKSVFNNAFKKYTGKTPSQYRKRHLA